MARKSKGQKTRLLDHDPNGNLTCDPTAPNAGQEASPLIAPGQTYTYDVENRLITVERATYSSGLCTATETVAEFRYDALGRRVETVAHIDPETGGLHLPNAEVTRHIHSGLTVVE